MESGTGLVFTINSLNSTFFRYEKIEKDEIIRMAKKKLQELYGSNPAIEITNRFKVEELMLNEQETLLWMGFFGKLHEEFCEKDAYFEIRGAQMGASFVAWLLGGTNVNPLPAHYYCPVCKKVEFVSGAVCGLDLTEKDVLVEMTAKEMGLGLMRLICVRLGITGMKYMYQRMEPEQ